MSGVNRLIKADVARKGLTGAAAMAKFSPAAIRSKGTKAPAKKAK